MRPQESSSTNSGLKKSPLLVAGDYDWGYGCGIGMKAYWEKHGKPFEIDPVIYTPLDKNGFFHRGFSPESNQT